MNDKREVTTEWKQWAMQVNANYHDGQMTAEAAEAMAGPEPTKHAINWEAMTRTALRLASLYQTGMVQ